MTVKMVVLWFSLVLCVVGSQAAGEFDVIHSPQSLKFSGAKRTSESLLKEVFSASLGLSVDVDAEWDGLTIVDPFTTPEAVVEIYVDGVSSLGKFTGLKTQTYSLYVDEYEPDTFDAIQHKIQRRFNDGDNKIVKFTLSDPNEFSNNADVFGDIKVPKVPKQTYNHLKLDLEEDYQFLYEIEAMKALTAQINAGAISADNIIDFYNFRFKSLHALSDFHGPNSPQVKEAKTILGEAIQELTNAFVKAYDGSVLVSVVSTDVAHTRRVRAVETQRATSYDAYSEDYSAIFNIILWFGVVFVFALIAIVYALVDMDPGRDSIIYRMTSTRMKKDN